MKQVTGAEIIHLFENWSPQELAFEGDPNGVHVGQLNRPVEKVLVTLDVNEAVIDEAIQVGANLIIAHHPPIFRPLKNIQTDTVQGRMLEKCILHKITVYAAHTNLDIATGGVNDMLAEKLSLQNIDLLEETGYETLYKLVVFTPKSYAEELRQGLGNAGAGSIGDYRDCSFTSLGEGRFTPSQEANPFIGKSGQAEVIAEEKVEVIVPESLLNEVLKAMHTQHPYEEPAYDIFTLHQKGQSFGIGRVGELEEELTLEEFAVKVKEVFQVPYLRYVGKGKQKIRRVAVLGGDGNKYIAAAKRKGADVLVTGDVYYHVAHDAQAMDLALIDPGHNIEKVMIEGVISYMTKSCEKAGLAVVFTPSTVITEPFTFL